MNLKFGKTPARVDSTTLKFADVFRTGSLPAPPKVFGHTNLVAEDTWSMLANDQWSDCVFAGAAHETMIWTLEGGLERAQFTARDVLLDYSAVTGFDPSQPDTDKGADMQEAADYRQKTGIRDTNSARHKIDAYASLTVGDVDQLAEAVWLFGAVGVGVEVPQSMISQFNSNTVWSVVKGDKIKGGHYIPCVGRNSAGNFLFVSWGRIQAATPEWVKEYMDEGLVYLSVEMINSSTKMSPENFNLDLLTQYLKQIPFFVASNDVGLIKPSQGQIHAACIAARKAIQDYNAWESSMVPDSAIESVVTAALTAALNTKE